MFRARPAREGTIGPPANARERGSKRSNIRHQSVRVLHGGARRVVVAVGAVVMMIALAQLVVPAGKARVGATTRECGWALVMFAPSDPDQDANAAERSLEARCDELRYNRVEVGAVLGVVSLLLIVMPFVRRLD